MNIHDLVLVFGFLFGGAGLTTAYMTLRTARKTVNDEKRKKIVDEEFTAARGAGLLITTSSEAINVFNVALKAAQEDLQRRDAMIDKLETKITRLEARVRELEGKTP